MARVRIPTPLRNLTNGEAEVEAGGSTVSEVLKEVDSQFPGLADRIYDESGEIRRFVNIYVDDEDIRFEDGVSTVVGEKSVLSIVPAVAGG